MNLSHYFYLYPSYGIAILGWILCTKYISTSEEENTRSFQLKSPWLEFIFSLLAAVATIGIGQLYINNLLIPKIEKYSYITESLNQIFIFSPFLLLLVFRKQPLSTAWIPKNGKLTSLVLGLILAMVALLTFLLLKGKTNLLQEFSNIYHYKNLSKLVQVFAEDFAISICLFRLIQWIGSKKAIVLIAILFAAGHIPAMLSVGVGLENFSSLILDTLLGVFVLHALYKSKNFLWFWMVHYAMDMTQFIN